MTQGKLAIAISALLFPFSTTAALWQNVDPFIGTEGTVPGTAFNGGNVFPGAAIPFGMVKNGPDTTSFNTSITTNGGYTPDGNVTAFSLTHVSGTGGGPIYGVVSQMPLGTLEGVNVLDNITYMAPREGNDTATVGYYKSTFVNGIVTELAAARRSGFIQYSFPQSGERHVLVDVSHYLPLNQGFNQAQYYSNGQITVSEDGRMYTGYGVYRGGFAQVPNYQIFFCGEFDQAPQSASTFTGLHTDPYYPSDLNAQPIWSNTSTVSGGPSYYNLGRRVGSLFTFSPSTSTLKSRIGISFVSADNACSYLAQEIPHWNINQTISEAQSSWESAFSKIQINDQSNSTRLKMFYTAFYHTELMPTDRTGDNPHWETTEPSYDDIYTFWDTFRCLNSLFVLIVPERAIGIVRSVIDVWRYEQFMPDGRSGNSNGQVQGGSNSDNILADAYVKGLTGGIDWEAGYQAMKTNAELIPPNNFDPGDTTGSTLQGRGALYDWLKYGYLTPNFDRSVSRTVEYSLNDYSLSVVAAGVAPDEQQKYLKRSAGWQYQWQDDLTSLNFTGFITPKYENGSRDTAYDPGDCGEFCENGGYTYEALGWEYSWTIPFDMETLIDLMGGPNTTEKRLDQMFVPGLRTSNVGAGGVNGIGTTLFNPGNEPSFSTPFLYHYLPRRQHRSVQRSREIVNLYYNTGRSGLPGNSDSGAIDSWLMWQMMGMYPVVTQPVYLILAPMFSNYTMKVGIEEKELRVTAEGLSDESFYVQSLKVNGVDWNKNWLGHDDIKNGGTLEFVLGSEPVEWDTGAVPPSPGHYVLKQ